MNSLRQLTKTILSVAGNGTFTNYVQNVGLKSIVVPVMDLSEEMPERRKLRVAVKSPVLNYASNMRPFKTQKKLRLMRGPETMLNTLMYEKYGIIACQGGRLEWKHFEMIRMGLVRKLDFDRMFAVWRVDFPWQPCTQKALGMRMGSGKGNIAFYVTPVKAGRVLVEIAGPCEYFEVKHTLEKIAHRLPFAAKAVSQESLLKEAEQKQLNEERNKNPYNWKYIIQNNLLGYRKYASRYENAWYNEYL